MMATIQVMFHLLHLISKNLQLIVEHGGYFFLFITTTLEGIPIIGQFIPGHTIILIAGFLAKLHILNLPKVIIVVMFSAMLGDFIGFFLGKKYGLSFFTKFGSYFFIKTEYIEKVQELVKNNPFKTIVFGRFSPLTRPLAPFIVGASGLHPNLFWVLDLISVFLWSVISVALGYLFGSSYHVVSAIFGKYIFIALIIGCIVAWLYRFVNKYFHIFQKYDLIILGINLLGLYTFFKTIQDALTDKVFLLELDLYVNQFFTTHSQETVLFIMNTLTNAFSPVAITLIAMTGILSFLLRRNYYYACITFFALSGGYLITFLIKNLVLRIRPEHASILQGGYSFPSGHAVAITILSTLLVYFYGVQIKSMIKREIFIVLCVLLVLAVSFSRIYLGVHWLSDVLAGIGFGLFWTTSVILLVKYINTIVKVLKNKKTV